MACDECEKWEREADEYAEDVQGLEQTVYALRERAEIAESGQAAAISEIGKTARELGLLQAKLATIREAWEDILSYSGEPLIRDRDNYEHAVKNMEEALK